MSMTYMSRTQHTHGTHIWHTPACGIQARVAEMRVLAEEQAAVRREREWEVLEDDEVDEEVMEVLCSVTEEVMAE